MKKRRIIAIGCALFALSLVSVLFALHRRDPVFEGRRLSDWVVSIGLTAGGLDLQGSEMPPDPGIVGTPSDAKAREAISKLGPNALPLLASMLGSPYWPFEAWLQRTADKNTFLRKFVRPANTVAAQHIGAVGAFYLLGSRGTPALPDITPMLTDPKRAMMAMFAVMYINPENEQDVLSLTNVLSIRTAPPGQSTAALHFNNISPLVSIKLSVVVLREQPLRRSGPMPRGQAMRRMGRMGVSRVILGVCCCGGRGGP